MHMKGVSLTVKFKFLGIIFNVFNYILLCII